MQCDLSYTTSVKDQPVIHAGFVKCLPRPRPGAGLPPLTPSFTSPSSSSSLRFMKSTAVAFERGAVLPGLCTRIDSFGFHKFVIPQHLWQSSMRVVLNACLCRAPPFSFLYAEFARPSGLPIFTRPGKDSGCLPHDTFMSFFSDSRLV